MLVVALILPVVLLAYAVAFFASIDDLRLDSRAYPQGLIVVLVLLLLWQIVADVRAWLRGEEGERVLGELWARWHRTAYVVGLTSTFAFAIGRIGFYEAMIPYVAILLPLIGVRNPLLVAVFTAGCALVVYALFTLVLGVRLPQGLLGI
jgi:hypothetical protein